MTPFTELLALPFYDTDLILQINAGSAPFPSTVDQGFPTVSMIVVFRFDLAA